MTFTIKVRGALGGMTTAEYRCPVHGVFEATVERTAVGDAPDFAFCNMEMAGSEPDASGLCPPCLRFSPWTLTSPPAGNVRLVEAVRGKADPAPTPMACDTRALAEGMSPREWKQRRATMWRDVDYRQHKEDSR